MSPLKFKAPNAPLADQPSRKRRPSTSEAPASTRKSQRVQQAAEKKSQPLPPTETPLPQLKQRKQLPTPSPSKAPGLQIPLGSPNDQSTSRKRKVTPSGADSKPIKRTRDLSESDRGICHWLSSVPSPEPDNFETMDPPPSKRTRSLSGGSPNRSPSREGSESAISRDAKYSAYKDSNYHVILETKYSFMNASDLGISDEDQELCQTMLQSKQPIPHESMFQDTLFRKLYDLLQGRSEARVFLDLHPLLVPSAENLFIQGNKSLMNLIEGHNDPWLKAIPFFGPRPQPDHTVGFKWSCFSEEQRRKLGIEPWAKSYYQAREDIYFPFLTSEVKCGKQALDLADRPNAHSMTIAVRAVVELYRKVKRESEIHRRVLAFSISHDANAVRIYGHYPEIEGDTTKYYRHAIEEYRYIDERSTSRWTAYQFTRNIYEIFAPDLLKRIKSTIDQLPDPDEESVVSPDDTRGQGPSGSQDAAIGALSLQGSGASVGRGRATQRVNPELRAMIQSLESSNEKLMEQMGRQREQMQEILEQQREQSQKQLEQQREEAKRERDQLLERLLSRPK